MTWWWKTSAAVIDPTYCKKRQTGLRHISTIRRMMGCVRCYNVVDQEGNPVAGAAVQGSWSAGGSSTAVTNTNGQCTVSKTKIKTSVTSTTFTVTNVSGAGYIYDPGSNVVGSIEVSSP